MRYLLVLLLAGCATATPINDQDGRKAVLIECDGMAVPLSACYKKAEETCPTGYYLVGQSGGTSGYIAGPYAAATPMTKNIVVRCK